MTINTRLFGEITVNEEKVIHFENGIIGFPDMQNYLIIFDKDKGDKSMISWLQSIEEPGYAIPILNPLLVKDDYNPVVNDELLKPLGELDTEETIIFVTITIPSNLENTTVNLKAPIIINAITRQACQIVVENDNYLVKYPVYEIFKERSEKVGE